MSATYRAAAIDTDLVNVTTSVTQIAADEPFARKVFLRSKGSGVTVFLGASDVTLANGFRLRSGYSLELYLPAYAPLYGIADSSTQSIWYTAQQLPSDFYKETVRVVDAS